MHMCGWEARAKKAVAIEAAMCEQRLEPRDSQCPYPTVSGEATQEYRKCTAELTGVSCLAQKKIKIKEAQKNWPSRSLKQVTKGRWTLSLLQRPGTKGSEQTD